MASFKYLVYDIESVINKPLLNKVLYAGEGLTDEEAYQKELAEMQKKDPERTFINPSFHKPISLAAVAVNDDFSIKHIGLMGKEKPTTRSIVEHFWELYNKDQPVLVDFNGSGFDVRVLELWAFQLGIVLSPFYFKKFGPRTRYADEHHIDLHDFLTNYRAVSFKGGLDLFSKLLGKPGKTDTKGNMVQELYDQKEFFRINDYCLGDTMDTYYVFLRTRVMRGELPLAREQELVAKSRLLLEEKRTKEGFFKTYLEHFGDWKPEE